MKNTVTDQTNAATSAGAIKAKVPPRPKTEKIYIWQVEQNEAGDEVKGLDCGSFPVGHDYETYIKRNLPYGRYRIECRAGGQLPAKWITTFDYVEPLRRADEDDEDDLDLAVEDAGAAGVSLSDVARIAGGAAAVAVAKVFERAQATAQTATAQVDDIEARVERIFERRKRERDELLAEVREEHARLNPATKRGERETSGDDPIMGAVAELAKSDPALAAKVVESVFPTKDDGWVATIANAAMNNPQAAQQILAGALVVSQSVFGSIFKSAGQQPPPDGAPMPQPNPAPVEQPDPMIAALEPARPVVEYITTQLLNNEDYPNTLAAIEQATEANPQLALGLAALAQMSSVEVLNTLARFTGQGILLKLKHGAEWIEGLQSVLRGEAGDEDDEDAPELEPVGSNNGTRAHAGAQG